MTRADVLAYVSRVYGPQEYRHHLEQLARDDDAWDTEGEDPPS